MHLDEEEGEVLEYELQRRFQSMVGSLMYASVNTRPDIAFSVSQLARVVSRPLLEHLDAAERLVRYCMATSRVGLQYSVHGQLKQKGVEEVSTKIGALGRRGHLYLSCFTDATWASDISDATSHGGYICCVGGSPVSWKSKKQGEIAHSSTESEYMALVHGVKEVVWMRRLLEELGQEQEGPTPVFCDSQGAIAMARNAVFHGLNKHMHIKWHWVRKEVKKGTISLHYINTTKQPADFLTKRLAEHQHWSSDRDGVLNRGGSKSSEAMAKAPLDEVVMDVVGPLKLGAAGAEYFLTIVDVYTRMTWVYVLSKKNDVAETVKTDWLPMVERQQDRLVKAIRTYRGGEFLSKEFSLWLKKNGIRHSLTMPYSPAMNGIAERANRTITETARGLLIEAGLLNYFRPDAVRSACVAKNRALTRVGAEKWVPYVEWIGRKPKVDMLRVFGCMCMALQRQGLHVPAAEEEGRGKRRIQAPNRLTYDALGKPDKSAVAGAALIVGDDEESDYEECAFAFFSPVEMPGEPATLKEALESSDAEEWKKAMESEVESIKENGTWELVEQRKYLEALAANFGQIESHVATPFPSGLNFVQGPKEDSVGEEERHRFHSLVGSLMYAAVNTRPDDAFATGQRARVVQCPNEEHVAVGMRLAKYLGKTPTVGLQYSAVA
ncbi:unnamed protein product [Closterium sp. NIES-53]